jgi:hypothetical protein
MSHISARAATREDLSKFTDDECLLDELGKDNVICFVVVDDGTAVECAILRLPSKTTPETTSALVPCERNGLLVEQALFRIVARS